MIYYGSSSELEVISQALRGGVNDILICRDRRSPSGALYLLWVMRDRTHAKLLLDAFESDPRGAEQPYLERFAQNEALVFVFPYREERRFSEFAQRQMLTPAIGEQICVQLVMECLSCTYPWPLLYLILSQDKVQINRDNSIFFSPALDLSDLDPSITERECVAQCAELLLELLYSPLAGRREGKHRSRKKLQSLNLIQKKNQKGSYSWFSELYRDIRMSELPPKKAGVRARLSGIWNRNQTRMFRILLVVCVILVVLAILILIQQAVFGDIPLLRLFRHTFDIIGTENLHIGGSTG